MRHVLVGQPGRDHRAGDLVRHQFAVAHELLRREAQFGAMTDVDPEDVPGRDVRDTHALGQQRGLGALTGTLWSDDQYSHQRKNPS